MSAITEFARDKACTIQIPGHCNGNPETSVWCHENSLAAGKGMGLKAHDHNGAIGCSTCHMIYDRQCNLPKGLTRAMVDRCFARGKALSQAKLIAAGLWDGKTPAPRKEKRPAKSKKIPVTGLSSLQRLCMGGK